MAGYLDLIDEKYPVRLSGAQKEAFRAWALEEAEKNGIAKAAAENNGGHTQLVFGDPEKAKVVFTAHYDTPRRSLMPNLMLVSNPILYWAYNLSIALIILAAAVGASLGVRSLLGLDRHVMAHRFILLGVYMAVYFGLFMLILKGSANKRNRNDNTSGTAAVMELTRVLAGRENAALILFDDEEKGKKGSKAFAKEHPAVRENTLVVNLDCVGNGDTFVFCPTRGAQDHPMWPALKSAMEKAGLSVRFLSAGRAQMNSDQKSFSRGVGVCACMHRPVIGFYADRIHTCRDTVAEPDNIDRLADALAAFAKNL